MTPPHLTAMILADHQPVAIWISEAEKRHPTAALDLSHPLDPLGLHVSAGGFDVIRLSPGLLPSAGYTSMPSAPGTDS
jgi:hypothetical protein